MCRAGEFNLDCWIISTGYLRAGDNLCLSAYCSDPGGSKLNSAFIWIIFPSLVAVILLFLQNRERLVAILATITAAVLALLAVWLPLQEQIILWRWVIPFSDTFLVFGRRIVLSAADRPSLIVIYLVVALWFGASPLARPNKLFVPLGLGITALLTAAIAIEPFLFAAVLIEIAVLASIPFLSPPGNKAGRGVLRYLTFQTIGMPFILISGFMFTGFEVGPGNPEFVAIATASDVNRGKPPLFDSFHPSHSARGDLDFWLGVFGSLCLVER
jgi:hypothetical protein